MAGVMVFAALAAFGAMCALWIFLGIWFPGDRAGVMIYCWRSSAAGRGFAVRWRIQWDLGLIRGKLAVVDLGLTEEDRLFLARWGRNVEIWEMEREHGERIGNYSGRHRRSDLSKL